MRIVTKLAYAAAAVVAAGLLPGLGAWQTGGQADYRFTADGKLEYPEQYREWVFLSSGKGMTYGPAANPNGAPQFDNVFVNPAAYREFLKSGRWPDQSIFILEIREAKTQGSINTAGQFQGETTAVEVLVKDKGRFGDTQGWGFFEYGAKERGPVAKLGKTSSCYGCHAAAGGVEFTFVQFYPTLAPVAEKFKTMRKGAAIH